MKSTNVRFGLSFLFGLALLIGGVVGVAALLARPGLPGEALALPLPDVTLHDVTGAAVDLSDLRGQPLLINFWATWCPPCDEEMPALEALHRQYPEVAVIAVNLGESSGVVAQYVAARGLAFPVLLDGEGALAARLDVTYLPTTFFVDAQGVMRGRVRRAMAWDDMEQAANALR